MFDVIVELGRERRWRYVEFRGGETILPSSASVAATYYGHTLDLTVGTGALFCRLASPVRRAVRKSIKSGLSVDVSNSRTGMLQFYKLHARTRRRHGLPPQSLSFFANIYDEIIKPGHGFVIIARKSKTPVAAAIFFHSDTNALYKFGASEDKLQQLRGNNLVMWEAIGMLAERGVRTLHFGRTAGTNAGLRRFKLAWGTEEQVVKYFRCSCDGRSSRERRSEGVAFYNKIFRWLPIAASRGIGKMLYPHLD
ncbi:MAG TPA: GNAT family N-acetyltransferase [Terriglobales bacterium]|nr:GNAT family N-acetyltransferase [Terriglobales bacterium]